MATVDIHAHTEVHHHDDHEDHEHHGNFWTNYIFCQDHKVIAKQFLITGMAWALTQSGQRPAWAGGGSA